MDEQEKVTPPVPSRFPRKYLLVTVVSVLIVAVLSSVITVVFIRNQQTNQTDTIATSPSIAQPTATPSKTNDEWNTYTNEKYRYSIQYPASWKMRTFPDTGSGAAFQPGDKPIDYQYEYIRVNTYNRMMFDGAPNLSFEEYVKRAGSEIQNYGELASLEKLTTSSGVTGYIATWMVTPMGGGKASESLPRAYFEIPGDMTATIQVDLGDNTYLQTFQEMVMSFAFKDAQTQSPTSTDPNVKTYVSKPLGVSFTYLKSQPEQGHQLISVFESGNKICVTYEKNDTNCEKGQFVEVLEKQAHETMEQAITRLFLSGKDPAQCFVETYPLKHMPKTFIGAQISFPEDQEYDMETMWKKTQYCSEKYARTNGVRYFLSDSTHPTKLIFVSIGQYGIMSENQTPWQYTIRFP